MFCDPVQSMSEGPRLLPQTEGDAESRAAAKPARAGSPRLRNGRGRPCRAHLAAGKIERGQ